MAFSGAKPQRGYGIGSCGKARDAKHTTELLLLLDLNGGWQYWGVHIRPA